MLSNARRAVVIASAVAALAPASASAQPRAQAPAGHGEHATSAKLELGATVLAGGSVALLVFGTIGIATVGERRHTASAR